MILDPGKTGTGHVARRSRRHVLQGLIGALAGAAGPAVAATEGPPLFETARHPFTVLQPARAFPSVRLTRIDGVIHDFALFSGKVMLVNFWATWCPACRSELPLLDRLQASVGHKNLQVIAIALDRNGRAAAIPFLRELNIRHLDIYFDPDGLIARKSEDENDVVPFPLYGMPISYVIGASGMLEGYIVGEADWSSDAARKLLGYYARTAQE
jgi:thiol-disulfide isomerase/thioredoxin